MTYRYTLISKIDPYETILSLGHSIDDMYRNVKQLMLVLERYQPSQFYIKDNDENKKYRVWLYNDVKFEIKEVDDYGDKISGETKTLLHTYGL